MSDLLQIKRLLRRPQFLAAAKGVSEARGAVVIQRLERGDGSITIVSSIGGIKGSPIIGAYCISKAADMQMARNFSVEFGPRGVRVSA